MLLVPLQDEFAPNFRGRRMSFAQTLPLAALLAVSACSALPNFTMPEAVVTVGTDVCLPVVGCHRLEVVASSSDSPKKVCAILGPFRYCVAGAE